jgi:flagellar basal-body rod protein FlgF
MDNSLMVGLSAQQALRRRMDMTANNLANMTTTGFKAEKLVLRELVEAPAEARDGSADIAFVDAWRLQRDMSTGAMLRTGNPLDVAIDGEGFFAVETAAGPAYTRDGRFALLDGRLVTRAGQPVLAPGLVEIDPAAGDVTIDPTGAIRQNGAEIGRLTLVAFDQPDALEKLGDNLWGPAGQTARPAEGARIAQGFVEGSNVNAVAELTQMIEISRAYQSVSRMLSQSDELRGAAINKLSSFR